MSNADWSSTESKESYQEWISSKFWWSLTQEVRASREALMKEEFNSGISVDTIKAMHNKYANRTGGGAGTKDI